MLVFFLDDVLIVANGTIVNDNSNPVLVTLGLLHENDDDDGVGGADII